MQQIMTVKLTGKRKETALKLAGQNVKLGRQNLTSGVIILQSFSHKG